MKPISNWPGYLVTEDGDVYSSRSGKVTKLKAWDKRGYLQVTLRKRVNGVLLARPQPVHRLVAIAFHGEPESDDLQVRHLNGTATDNRATNLAWGTAGDNAADAVRHGTLGPGPLAHRKKLNGQQVSEIRRRIAAGEHTKALAQEFGVSEYYPSYLVRRASWPNAQA